MIETLSLQNFKVLRSVDVRLRPLTLIVGPNGSGKSSLLLALDYLARRLTDRGVQGLYLDYSEFRSQRSLGDLALTCTGVLEEEPFFCSVEFGDEGRLKRVWGGNEPPSSSRIQRALNEPVILNLDIQHLAAPAPAQEIVHALPPDGSGLAWILAGLHLEDHERFNAIVVRLRAVVPTVQGLRIKRTTLAPKEVGYELLFDMKAGEGIPARHVSEGTLVTLALLVLLAGPKPPGLILVENLERGLHPKALRDLVDQIRLLQKQNPRLQVVATSHSPYLLDYLEADEILLTSLDEDGYASVKALSQHPEYDRWKDVMAPGEFWSTVGESW